MNSDFRQRPALTIQWRKPGIAVVLACSLAGNAYAGISTDGSLGQPAQILTGPNYTIPESLGKISGNNLFQSFQTFDILSGESATFTTTTAGLANVISRVTGGTPSAINGLLALTPCVGCGAPNFFFINPAGVTFGAGATVNVPGAFHVGTADYVKFPDGNYYADLAKTSTFSTAPPEAFGFLGATSAAVTVTGGAALSTTGSNALSVAGGDVAIDGGTVSTKGGEIRIAAVGLSTLDVTFTGALPAAYGSLSVLNGSVVWSSTQTATNGSPLRISTGSMLVDGGCCYTNVATTADVGTGAAGDVVITATGNLSVSNGSAIYSGTYTSGAAGNIDVSAANITLDGKGFYGSIYSNALGGTGNAGNVTINTPGMLSMLNGGYVSSDTSSAGLAGYVLVNAGSIAIDGRGSTAFTGISSDAMAGTGSAGYLDIYANGNLSIVNGGQISSSTWTSGNAGYIWVNAGGISLDDQGYGGTTGIFSHANSGTGFAGYIDVTSASSLSIANGAVISSSTWSSGDAGYVWVSTGSLSIDSKNSPFFTGIASNANTGSTGQAGYINVTATGSLSVVNGAEISSSTWSSGNAGYLSITAGNLVIDGQGSSFLTGITSDAVAGSSGNAGYVDVTTTAGDITLTNAGVISSSAKGTGGANYVSVASSGGILVDGGSSINAKAAAGSSGQVGNVSVSATNGIVISNAGELSILNAGTAANPATLLPTFLSVSASDVTLNGGLISASTSGNADASFIDVTASGILSIRNGGYVSSDTSSSGNAGFVLVNSGSIAIDGQGIGSFTGISSDALAGTGNAGFLDITTTGDLSIVNGGQISSSTWSSGNAGFVWIEKAGSITIDGQGYSGFTGISSDAVAGTGSAGYLDVTDVGTLSIVNGGQVSSSTWSSGNAGFVWIEKAGSITIDGLGYNGFTGISSDAIAGTGFAGYLDITATGNLSVINGGQISSSTSSGGDAGYIWVSAGTLNLDGQGSGSLTGIVTNAQTGSSGNAGYIDVSTTAGDISLINGSVISSGTAGSGIADFVKVASYGALMVQGSGSSINASAELGSSGQTGSVSVTAAAGISIINGGEIAIRNNATVANPAVLTLTSIDVTAPQIFVQNSADAITTSSTGNVAAGSISIFAADWLNLDPSGITTTSNQGNGGAISITTGTLTLSHSQISTSVLGPSGNGGNISISANSIILNSGFIQANTAAASASGGNVSIAAKNLIASGNVLLLGGNTPYTYQPGAFAFNVIQAAAPTGLSGAVHTTSPVLDVSSSLSALNTQAIDTGGLGRSPCQVSGGSSLAQSGRGGLPPSARGLLLAEPEAAGTAVHTGQQGENSAYLDLAGWVCS